MRSFSVPEVQQLTGVADSTIQDWVAGGIIKPVFTEHCGMGARRRFSWQTVFAVACIASLQRRGCRGEAIQKCLRFIARCDLKSRIALDFAFVVVAGDQVFACSREDVLRRQGGPGPVAFIIVDLAAALELFEKQLAALDGSAREPAGVR